MDPSSSQIDGNGNDLPAGGINIHERVWDISHTVNPDIVCEDPTDELLALQKEPSKKPDTAYQMAFQTGYPLPPEYGQPDQPEDLLWRVSSSSASISIVSTSCEGQKLAVAALKKIIVKLSKSFKIFNSESDMAHIIWAVDCHANTYKIFLEDDDKSLLFKGYFGGKAPRFETRSMLLDLSRFIR